jgi:hypothetical protein
MQISYVEKQRYHISDLWRKKGVASHFKSSYVEEKGAIMLQPNSFFARPTTHFGCYQHLEEDNEDLTQLWQFITEANTSNHQQTHIGVFLHWSDVTE